MNESFSVAAVHDMSGFGKCSLTVAIPVISSAGIMVCPLPTAVLSTHTAYPNFVFHELTDFMRKSVNHWQELGLKFNAVYSGFLGSEEQIDIVIDLIEKFPAPFVVVDPVLGDNGRPFPTISEGICKGMASLILHATVITPNLTEACMLTGTEYKGEEISKEEAFELCRKLQDLGCKDIVLTGVGRENRLYNYILQKDGQFYEDGTEKVGVMRHGTGDLFASVMTAGLVRGYSLRQSVASAAAFVHASLQISKEDEKKEGAYFEPILYKLASGIYMA